MKKIHNFLRRRSGQVGKIGIGVLVFVTAFVMVGAAYLFVQSADALALQNKKDTLQTSTFGALSQHTFVFTTQSALTTDAGAGADFSVVLNFPTDAGGDPFGTSVPNFVAANMAFSCTGGNCASHAFTVTDVEESSNGGAADFDEFLVAVSSNFTGNLNASAVATLTFGAATGAQRLTNPANNAAGCTVGGVAVADICRITINTSEAITGASPATVDSGDVLVALIEGVTVSASISESLSFSMAAGAACTGDSGDPAPTVRSATATTVPFAAISPNVFYVACQDLTVSTNAGTGYTVTAEENNNLKDATTGFTIDDTICDAGGCTEAGAGTAWANEDSAYGFGYWCEEGIGAGGTPCDNNVDTSAEHRQFACRGADPDCNPASTGGETAQQVMFGATAVNANLGRIHYKLSVSPTQSAATNYTNTITYIAVGTF